MECLKNLFLVKRGEITIVELARSVGNISKKYSWVNYIFIILYSFKLENMHSTVALYPSGLYVKSQDYRDALRASLGITCHLY